MSHAPLSLPLIYSLVLSGVAAAASSAVPPPRGAGSIATFQLPSTTATIFAKAQPDECFASATDSTLYPPPPCRTGLVPKVNQAYVWGMARSGSDTWFGTVANTECLVQGAFLGMTTPFQVPSWACQFGKSPYSAGAPFLPAVIGDWRRPQIWLHDAAPGALIRRDGAMSAAGQTLLARTIGIRAAGTAGGVVLLAGPGLAGGLNVFAFNAATRGFVGATSLPAYNNVRKFLVVNGVLYAGVGLPNPTASPSLKTGRILRWDLSGAFPYAVTEVGQVDSAASELALHEGRLFVTTWPDAELTSGKLAGLFMSPPLHGAGPGLDAGDAASWTRVWVASDYEPDPVTARSYGGGALASFGGYLFWGTMHVPLVSTELHAAAYPADFPSTTAGQVDWFVKSERAISLFRGRAFGTASQAIDLAYGLPSLPVYVPGSPGSWQTLPNGMGGAAPLFGVPGMGNPFNNYTWTMSVYDGRLWVGTMDWSYLFGELFSTFFPGAATPSVYGGASALRGADLWNFVSPSCPAVPENLDGICNVSSYGIRTMGADASGLLLGMANPMNLLASGSGPQGGWELIRLVAREPNTPVGQGVTVPTDVASVLLCNVTRAGTTYFQQLPVPTTLPVPASLLPSPYTRILAAYVFGSSAALATCGGQASPPGYGSFSVPRLNPAPTRLYALDSTGSSGPAWRDITTGETESTLSGTIPAPGAVILQVADASSAIPALGVPGALALALLLAAAGALALRRLG